jgi:uncharacterized membrane protein YdjX (TVP38/TMEM64 family)
MNKAKLLVALLIVALIGAVFVLGLHQYLSLDFLRAQQQSMQIFVEQNLTGAAVAFFFLYVTVAALNIPGAAIMTLAAGAVFGVVVGVIVVSFASAVGATLAFLLSRYLLRDYVERKFSWATEKINRGVEREGGYYLFTLRLVPVFPFFVINMVMALTRLQTQTFYWVSQIGMFPATVVYVKAGTQLGRIEDAADILSPAVLGSFALLGVFPIVAKKILEFVTNARSR